MRRVLLLLFITASAFGQTSTATAPFDVADLTAELQLAFELEVSNNGVRVLSGAVLWARSQQEFSFTDLEVTTDDDAHPTLRRRIPDPRLVFAAGIERKPRGRVTVFFPFSRTLRTLSVAPLSAAEAEDPNRAAYVLESSPFGRNKRPRTVRVDVTAAVREACRQSGGVCE